MDGVARDERREKTLKRRSRKQSNRSDWLMEWEGVKGEGMEGRE